MQTDFAFEASDSLLKLLIKVSQTSKGSMRLAKGGQREAKAMSNDAIIGRYKESESSGTWKTGVNLSSNVGGTCPNNVCRTS